MSASRALGMCIAASALTTLAACADLPPATGPERPLRTEDATSATIGRAAEEVALRELTRAVALALNNDGLRLRVGSDMAASRVREHKLELDAYLKGNSGGVLLASMAKESGLGRDSLAVLLAAVRPLEFYMPVRAHRRTWTGDANLLVAASVDDASIVAFDLSGAPVTLSIEDPPGTPTLALVPVETDFRAVEAARGPAARASLGATSPGTLASFSEFGDGSCDPTTAIIPCDEEPISSGPGPYPPGIYFTKLQIRDDHEPWLRGAPEIDMVFSGTVAGGWVPTSFDPFTRRWISTYDPNMRRLVYSDCAGEKAGGYRWFNADNTGTYQGWYNTLFAQTEFFAVAEDIYDATHSIVIRQRLVQMSPPFRAELMERDDGRQCPDPPRTFTLDFSVQFRFSGFPIRLQRFGWEDVNALFGNNNDRIATFFFSSFDELEGLNGTFRAGMDADAWFTNRGFSRYNIPAPQDPWNGY